MLILYTYGTGLFSIDEFEMLGGTYEPVSINERVKNAYKCTYKLYMDGECCTADVLVYHDGYGRQVLKLHDIDEASSKRILDTFDKRFDADLAAPSHKSFHNKLYIRFLLLNLLRMFVFIFFAFGLIAALYPVYRLICSIYLQTVLNVKFCIAVMGTGIIALSMNFLIASKIHSIDNMYAHKHNDFNIFSNCL